MSDGSQIGEDEEEEEEEEEEDEEEEEEEEEVEDRAATGESAREHVFPILISELVKESILDQPQGNFFSFIFYISTVCSKVKRCTHILRIKKHILNGILHRRISPETV